MAQCVEVIQDGINDGLLQVSSSACDYVLVTQSELQTLSDMSLVNTLNALFAFDLETFGLIHATCLATFVTAHGVGWVVRLLGKT
ncbi:hypothetical protein [Pseudoalteromonas ruthenica]|uniref:hypothetical protein n=1 Tax=Pseudoalteromonas ruthenica TaxID=151081 RepID=UPI00211DA481|nr:hypothetical protein [Pseudoalteromonas ruthenica]